MDFTIATIEEAYSMCYKSIELNASIGIVSAFCLIIMIKKLVSIYEKQKDEENARTFFEIARQYAKSVAFIIIFPFILPVAETALAKMQDKSNAGLQSSLNVSIEVAIKDHVENYIKKEKEDQSIISKAVDKLNPVAYFKTMYFMWTLQACSICLLILKYMYFGFVAGRYLWLLMLQLIAPIAIICSLWEKTESITVAFFKNLTICYLLIPIYLVANLFGECVVIVVLKIVDINHFGLMGVIGMMIMKFAFFGKATKYAFKLIH